METNVRLISTFDQMAFILKSNIILQIASISMTTRIVLIRKTMLRLKSMSTFLENA